MPRVLQLVTWLVPGGIEKWLLSMLTAIPRSKFALDFCCKGPSVGILADIAREQGADVIHCPLHAAHVGFYSRLNHILKSGHYDIVHNHLETYSGFPVWISQRLAIPVITSFHNTHYDAQTWTRLPVFRQLRSIYGHFSMRYALRHSDLVTGCSQSVLDRLEILDRNFKGKARVLYYGVNIPPLPTAGERGSFRESFGWSADTPLIVHVGRFDEQKNHIGLLDIFARVLKVVPEVRLLLIGDGSLRPLVQTTIQSRELSHAVRLLGFRDDVSWILSRCDVFLLPSLFEGFGLAALEANAAGIPVVASRVPGLTEAIREAETGELYEVRDSEGMAKSVIKLLQDQKLARRLGEAGRVRAQNEFSVETSARKLSEIYDECVGLG